MNLLLSTFVIFNAKSMQNFSQMGELLQMTEEFTPFDDNLPQFPSLLWLKRDAKSNDEMDISKFQTKLKGMVEEKTFRHIL